MAGKAICLELFSHCAARYEVSLTAAILKWLEFTPDAVVLVCSRDGFIDWAVSSQPALRNGAYFKTRGQPPIPVPAASLAACAATPPTRAPAELPRGVRFDGFGATEFAIPSGRYDMTLSLLLLADAAQRPARFR